MANENSYFNINIVIQYKNYELVCKNMLKWSINNIRILVKSQFKKNILDSSKNNHYFVNPGKFSKHKRFIIKKNMKPTKNLSNQLNY